MAIDVRSIPRLPYLSAAPGSAANGDTYFDSGTLRLVTRSGSAFVGPAIHYDGAGAITANVKVRRFTVTTDANGDWSVDYTALGLTTLHGVWPSAVRSTTDPNNMAFVATRSASLTAAAGTVVEGQAIAILGGLPLTRVPSGVTVYVRVEGV